MELSRDWRRLPDRRARPTTLWSALRGRGRRHGFRRALEGRQAYGDGLAPRIVWLAILVYGGNQVVDGAVSIGVLVTFVFYLQSFFDPIQSLSQLYTTYQAGMAALDKIFELLDEDPEISDRPGALELPRLRGEIEFDDVTFSYGDGEPALCDVSLHVPPGQTVALVGATGAGQLLGNLLCAVAGLLDGGPLAGLLGQLVGLLNQILDQLGLGI